MFKNPTHSSPPSIVSSLATEVADSDPSGTYFDEFDLTILEPSQGDEVVGEVEIVADATEYGDYSFLYTVGEVTYRINGEIIASHRNKNADGNYATIWDASTVVSGTYTINVSATERAEGAIVSDAITITLLNGGITIEETTSTETSDSAYTTSTPFYTTSNLVIGTEIETSSEIDSKVDLITPSFKGLFVVFSLYALVQYNFKKKR